MSTHSVSSVAITDPPFHGRNVPHTNTNDVKAASLLGLPAELRLKMYAEMSPPLNGHIADYQSLFLSCKKLKAEAEIEIVRNMQHFLRDVMKMVTRDMKLCLDNDTESPHAPGSNVDEIRFIWEDQLKSVTSTSYSERVKGLGYMGAYELWYLRKSTSSRGIFGFFWKRKQP
ncbi:uncharacterized protein J4E79_008962 [Alternaria viburni]|uniref:uncharacterized protein n=1 Tax=Alternaria viburni TaxID=566460 RepID=UPI0020C3C803|nr:uncharacterized protein J4E79_008962 [Alternaria viburni]KAI4652655.1 hypothetical protein J4E79_008962 [Alternaria viburni]